MRNDLQIFENEEFGKVRTIIIDGESWFVGKDVATALGYKDTSDALKRHVQYDDKLTRYFTLAMFFLAWLNNYRFLSSYISQQ